MAGHFGALFACLLPSSTAVSQLLCPEASMIKWLFHQEKAISHESESGCMNCGTALKAHPEGYRDCALGARTEWVLVAGDRRIHPDITHLGI